MKSAVDLPRVASRYCAPTHVPERNNCLPRIWTSVLLGSSENSLIIPSAYSFVLSFRSRSPMVGRLHPVSFIVYPFKPRRVRDTCPDKTRSSSFLAELPRFENSRNIEISVKTHCQTGLFRVRNSELAMDLSKTQSHGLCDILSRRLLVFLQERDQHLEAVAPQLFEVCEGRISASQQMRIVDPPSIHPVVPSALQSNV
jgi:hypothetical protein